MNKTGSDGSKVIALDFDRTIATHDGSKKYNHQELGEPIAPMVEQVKQMMASGHRFVIFTARVNPGNSYEEQMRSTESYLFIADWCQQVFGTHLPITFAKSADMEEFWDDRSRPVVPNTGQMLPSGMDMQPQEPAA